MHDAPAGTRQSSRLRHLVFGGGPKQRHGTEFRDPAEPLTRLFIPHLHRFLEPVSNGA